MLAINFQTINTVIHKHFVQKVLSVKSATRIVMLQLSFLYSFFKID